MPADPVTFARDLIRCPSVTPAEGGALDYLHGALQSAGFTVHRVKFSEPGSAANAGTADAPITRNPVPPEQTMEAEPGRGTSETTAPAVGAMRPC